jgi:hypothetical protein
VQAIGGNTMPSMLTAGTRPDSPDQIEVETFNNAERLDAPFKFVIITAPNPQ